MICVTMHKRSTPLKIFDSLHMQGGITAIATIVEAEKNTVKPGNPFSVSSMIRPLDSFWYRIPNINIFFPIPFFIVLPPFFLFIHHSGNDMTNKGGSQGSLPPLIAIWYIRTYPGLWFACPMQQVSIVWHSRSQASRHTNIPCRNERHVNRAGGWRRRGCR